MIEVKDNADSKVFKLCGFKYLITFTRLFHKLFAFFTSGRLYWDYRRKYLTRGVDPISFLHYKNFCRWSIDWFKNYGPVLDRNGFHVGSLPVLLKKTSTWHDRSQFSDVLQTTSCCHKALGLYYQRQSYPPLLWGTFHKSDCTKLDFICRNVWVNWAG